MKRHHNHGFSHKQATKMKYFFFMRIAMFMVSVLSKRNPNKDNSKDTWLIGVIPPRWKKNEHYHAVERALGNSHVVSIIILRFVFLIMSQISCVRKFLYLTFFDQCIHFFYHIINAWESFFYFNSCIVLVKLSSVVSVQNPKVFFPEIPQIVFSLLNICPVLDL